MSNSPPENLDFKRRYESSGRQSAGSWQVWVEQVACLEFIIGPLWRSEAGVPLSSWRGVQFTPEFWSPAEMSDVTLSLRKCLPFVFGGGSLPWKHPGPRCENSKPHWIAANYVKNSTEETPHEVA